MHDAQSLNYLFSLEIISKDLHKCPQSGPFRTSKPALLTKTDEGATLGETDPQKQSLNVKKIGFACTANP